MSKTDMVSARGYTFDLSAFTAQDAESVNRALRSADVEGAAAVFARVVRAAPFADFENPDAYLDLNFLGEFRDLAEALGDALNQLRIKVDPEDYEFDLSAFSARDFRDVNKALAVNDHRTAGGVFARIIKRAPFADFADPDVYGRLNYAHEFRPLADALSGALSSNRKK